MTDPIHESFSLLDWMLESMVPHHKNLNPGKSKTNWLESSFEDLCQTVSAIFDSIRLRKAAFASAIGDQSKSDFPKVFAKLLAAWRRIHSATHQELDFKHWLFSHFEKRYGRNTTVSKFLERTYYDSLPYWEVYELVLIKLKAGQGRNLPLEVYHSMKRQDIRKLAAYLNSTSAKVTLLKVFEYTDFQDEWIADAVLKIGGK